jgi:hypothetical protein
MAAAWCLEWLQMKTKLHLAGWLVMILFAPTALSQAQEPSKRFSIWDIHLGDAASAIPDEYVNYACGTNGGPPSRKLPNFAAFKICKPGADGLHEVYFEYDDEQEYVARALQDRIGIKRYAGTTVFEFPIVASVLFDDAGGVRGERMVTDPRQQVSRDRLEFWELANFLRQNYGDDSWTCNELPPSEGETPVGTKFMKSHCEKTLSGMHLILEQHFFQKKGQQFVDPQSGRMQPQAFESETRFEMYDAASPSH